MEPPNFAVKQEGGSCTRVDRPRRWHSAHTGVPTRTAAMKASLRGQRLRSVKTDHWIGSGWPRLEAELAWGKGW